MNWLRGLFITWKVTPRYGCTFCITGPLWRKYAVEQSVDSFSHQWIASQKLLAQCIISSWVARTSCRRNSEFGGYSRADDIHAMSQWYTQYACGNIQVSRHFSEKNSIVLKMWMTAGDAPWLLWQKNKLQIRAKSMWLYIKAWWLTFLCISNQYHYLII